MNILIATTILGVAILTIGATTKVFALGFEVNTTAAQNTTQQPQAQSQLEPIPQIPLIDPSYPNEVKTPFILSIINASEAFMKKAYSDQLRGNTEGYNFAVGLHNAMVCVHAQMNNDTTLMSGCDEPMVQEAILMHKGNAQYPGTVPDWFMALLDNYLMARGIQ